jgi:hypothetical protein
VLVANGRLLETAKNLNRASEYQVQGVVRRCPALHERLLWLIELPLGLCLTCADFVEKLSGAASSVYY